MRRTSALTLTVVGCLGLILGRAAPVVVVRIDGVAPTVGWTASLTLLFGAAVLAGLARATFYTLNRERRIMHSARGIRLLALAKASAVVGVLVAGFYAGYAMAFVGSWHTDLGQQRVIRSGAAAVSGVAVVVAALILERACRIPGDDDDEGSAGAASSPAPA